VIGILETETWSMGYGAKSSGTEVPLPGGARGGLFEGNKLIFLLCH